MPHDDRSGGEAAVSQPIEIITDPDVLARRKARAEEYGTWECGPNPIEFGGARAFNEGEPVPKSTVERLQLDNLGVVVPTGTFAKKSADNAEALAKAQDEALTEAVKAQAVKPAKAAPKGGNG
jgi:hypothetical protein